MTKIEQAGITWIDIKKPTKESIAAAEPIIKLHPIVKHELLVPAFRAKTDVYEEEMCYLVLHFPVFDEETQIAQPQELDFVITKKVLLTAHYEKNPALEDVIKELTENEQLRKRLMRINTVRLAHEIILRNFNLAGRQLDHIEKQISLIEKRIFSDRGNNTVREISLLRSDIINFSRAMRPLEPVFDELRDYAKTIFGKQWSIYFTNMVSDYRKTINIIETRSQAIESLRVTNDSLISFHTNRFLKILAIINLLVLPIIIIESLIGARWYLQEIRGSFAAPELLYAVILGIAIDLALLAFFRYKKWL